MMLASCPSSSSGRTLFTTAVAVIVLVAHLLAGCCAESEATSVDCPAAAPAASPRSVTVRTQASDPPCADATFEPVAVVLGSDEVGALVALVVLGFVADLSSHPPATTGRRRGAPRAPPSYARRLTILSVLRT